MTATTTPLQEVRRRGRVRGSLALLGPAFVAAIAYVDPGNFATNVSAGAELGYRLAWVILLANAMAMLVQSLSGKVGIATGRNLPELCRDHFPRPVVRGLWLQAELVAMATDLAEVIGGAIALSLLFGLPLLTGGAITALVAFALLSLQGKGFRPFELAVTGLLAVIALGFVFSATTTGVDGGQLARGLVPSFSGVDSVLLATGILGATVMPHVIYLHSALTAGRIAPQSAAERQVLLRSQRVDVVVAMGLAGLVNLAMLVLAARLFFGEGLPGVDTLEGAHAALERVAGAPVAFAFAVALLASGFASSGVGTYAGQVVMQGFLRRSIPLVLRRGITLAPALVVLAVGAEPTQALVLSQVVLSFGIPFALVPLVLLTRRADVMGELVNRPVTTAAAWVVAGLVIALNLFLLAATLLSSRAVAAALLTSDVAPAAAVGDVAELLDVHVQQRPWLVVLVAADLLAGALVDVPQLVEPAPHQHRMHGRGRHVELRARSRSGSAAASTAGARSCARPARGSWPASCAAGSGRSIIPASPDGGVPAGPPLRGRPRDVEVAGGRGHGPAVVHDQPGEPEPSTRRQSSVSVNHEDLLGP